MTDRTNAAPAPYQTPERIIEAVAFMYEVQERDNEVARIPHALGEAARASCAVGVADPAAVRALVEAARAMVTNPAVIRWGVLPIADGIPFRESGPLQDAFTALSAALTAFPDGAR
jgi:hypothetical protein